MFVPSEGPFEHPNPFGTFGTPADLFALFIPQTISHDTILDLLNTRIPLLRVVAL